MTGRKQATHGPCSSPGNCTAEGGVHWEEANPNAGGYHQTISLVDDLPARARRICFWIGHPYAADYPVDSQYQVTVQVTDPSGATATRSFTLAKGQRTQAECSPAAQAPPRLGTVRPPAWWLEGRRLIRARGGRCTRSSRQIEAQDPATGEPGGTTYTETEVRCQHPIPKRLGVKWGGNPAARSLGEGCSSLVSDGNPEGDAYAFHCTIFGARRLNGDPRLSSWRCQRFKSRDLRYHESDRAWTAQRRPRGGKSQVRSLRRCVTRRPPR